MTGVRPKYGDSWCFFHGREAVDETTYTVCGECGHVWTASALLEAERESGSALPLGEIFACPECAHDF